MRSTMWLAVVSCLVVVGCGGSNNRDNPDNTSLRLADDNVEPLQVASDPQLFDTYLKNGLRLRAMGGTGRAEEEFVGAPVPIESDADSAGAGNSGNFSDTNVHVAGVDEADRVKYDGQHLFIAVSPTFNYYPTDDGYELRQSESGIRILAATPEEASAQEVAYKDLSNSDYNLSALYLVADAEGTTRDMVGIGHKYHYNAGIWNWSPWGYGDNDRVLIDSYDVTEPSAPEQAWRLELDGGLADSRKIGNVLYLVTRYSPMIEGLQYYPSTATARRANEQLIADTPMAQLLPRYRVNGGSEQPLVTSNNCYVPEGIESNWGYANIVTITAIDLQSRELLSSVCLNSAISGIHVSTDNIYLGASVGSYRERQTGVHKFALNEGQIRYRGTGVVRGQIGWSAASFRMNEHEDHLRIVTTDMHFSGGATGDVAMPDIWPPALEHRLSVLREQPGSNRLEVVATLPNESRPQAIGKPGEDIYAVRFQGDRAYVVTFERIDPLYVMDLSNPQDPRITSELEMPGYSTYLHPIGSDYLLGIGEEVTEIHGWPQPAGVKVELYDVRNLEETPKILGTFVVGSSGTTSPALYDLRAINFLRTSEDQLRFTLPVDVVEDYWHWKGSALYLYEVNGLAGADASLTEAGTIVGAQGGDNENYFWRGSNGYDARSRLHDEAVYFIYGKDVWSAFWSAPEEASLQTP